MMTTLENGLTIIVREDHSAPVVSAQAWSMTGSINEGRWLGAGMSHVLEHMLFKGTTTRGAARIDQEVQEVDDWKLEPARDLGLSGLERSRSLNRESGLVEIRVKSGRARAFETSREC